MCFSLLGAAGIFTVAGLPKGSATPALFGCEMSLAAFADKVLSFVVFIAALSAFPRDTVPLNALTAAPDIAVIVQTAATMTATPAIISFLIFFLFNSFLNITSLLLSS